MAWHWIVPKTFLLRFPLSTGAIAYGGLMIVLMVISIIVSAVEMLNFHYCEDYSGSVLRSAYGFSCTTIIFSLIMICINIWFIWAIKMNKASVVLVWLIMTAIWLAQGTIVLLVLLGLFSADTSFAAWLLCLLFGFTAFVICMYGILVGYGLWRQMKNRDVAASPSAP